MVQARGHFINYNGKCVNDLSHEIRNELFNPWKHTLNALDVNFFN